MVAGGVHKEIKGKLLCFLLPWPYKSTSLAADMYFRIGYVDSALHLVLKLNSFVDTWA